jgi:ribosome-associated protein
VSPFDPPEGYAPPETDDELLAECTVNTFRAGGPGGQHQNMTDSAVRLRHRPTGITVTCRGERSQYQNKQTCLRRLRARIEDLLREPPPRRPTRPSRSARETRLEEKTRRAQVKRERRPPSADE